MKKGIKEKGNKERSEKAGDKQSFFTDCEKIVSAAKYSTRQEYHTRFLVQEQAVCALASADRESADNGHA